MMRFMTVLAMILGASGFAMAQDCRYQTRPNDVFFQNLPSEIKGWVNCGASGGNVIYVAKTEKKSVIQWQSWFREYQLVLNPEEAKITVLKSGKLAGGIETHWLESQRSTGATRHLLIVKPDGRKNSLVFIQSANVGTGERAAFTVSDSLRRIIRGVDAVLLDREFPLN